MFDYESSYSFKKLLLHHISQTESNAVRFDSKLCPLPPTMTLIESSLQSEHMYQFKQPRTQSKWGNSTCKISVIFLQYEEKIRFNRQNRVFYADSLFPLVPLVKTRGGTVCCVFGSLYMIIDICVTLYFLQQHIIVPCYTNAAQGKLESYAKMFLKENANKQVHQLLYITFNATFNIHQEGSDAFETHSVAINIMKYQHSGFLTYSSFVPPGWLAPNNLVCSSFPHSAIGHFRKADFQVFSFN